MAGLVAYSIGSGFEFDGDLGSLNHLIWFRDLVTQMELDRHDQHGEPLARRYQRLQQ